MRLVEREVEFDSMTEVEELARQQGVGEGGFNMVRWGFWNQRLHEIMDIGKVEGAKELLRMMEEIEHPDRSRSEQDD